MMQLTFDPVDAMSFPERLLRDPVPGLPPLRLELHEAVGDAQVNNLVTNWIARSIGVPLVTPSPLAVWGLDTVQVPAPGRTDLPGALFVYDEGYPPGPTGNVPPADDNGTHEGVRRLDAYKAQLGAFLEDGTDVQVCDGACDPD